MQSIPLTLKEIRKNNLRHLINRIYRSQAAIAEKLPRYSQQNISDLLLGKKHFHRGIAGYIEVHLELPNGWLDKIDSIRKNWKLVLEYRQLDPTGRETCNRVADFLSKPEQLLERKCPQMVRSF